MGKYKIIREFRAYTKEGDEVEIGVFASENDQSSDEWLRITKINPSAPDLVGKTIKIIDDNTYETPSGVVLKRNW